MSEGSGKERTIEKDKNDRMSKNLEQDSGSDSDTDSDIINGGKHDSSNDHHLDSKQNHRNTIDNSDALSTSASANTTKNIEWSPENESIMVEWCDVAQCYKWLNARSYSKYSYKNAWYTIPAIVLSTISGTASFAQTSLPIAYQVYSPMAIGAINIFIGILTTVHQYLKISELTEAHRVSSISWDKFARNIRIELAKKPEERMDAGHFLKLNRQEFDRMMETSPMINQDIINEFNSTFQGKPGTIERQRYEALKKPDICNTIISANETRHHWYLELDKVKESIDTAEFDEASVRNKDDLIARQRRKLHEKEEELKRGAEAAQELSRRKKMAEDLVRKREKELEEIYTKKCEIAQTYIITFQNLYSRKPMPDEIIENLKDEIDLDALNRFLTTYDNSNV
jgi:hypothetical protein